MISSQLGRYKILEELGRGAMGRVFLAHDPQIDRRVAVKTVQAFAALPEADREQVRLRFQREARAVGRLAHPGIVTLFDAGEADDLLYLVMEYVEGTSLDAFCRKDRLLPRPTAVELVANAAEALHYAHHVGVVHRDIKPANLIRVGEAAVKVTDFGVAQIAEARLTQDGALKGTPSYMSPEQIRGQPLDGRSDLFSLTAVLFELLSGELPFPGDSVSSIIYRIVNEEARDPQKVEPPLPPELSGFLVRGMSKSPQDRFENGAGFAAELRRVAGTLRAVGSPPDLPEREPAPSGSDAGGSVPPPPARRRPGRASARPFVMGVLLFVVALVALAYFGRGHLGLVGESKPKTVWWEASVRTEPPGLELLLDGAPIPADAAGTVRFASTGPFGTLSAVHECRTIEHVLEPVDAGGEIVLVADPVELGWQVDPGVGEARVLLNGQFAGAAPADLQLELCRENRVEVEASGFKTASIVIPSGATPLEARALLNDLGMEAIPRGRLALAGPKGLQLVYYLDGRRLRKSELELELEEGEYELRFKNDFHWIDKRIKVRVEGGKTVTPDLDPPPLADLRVQAFPANCKVFLRKPGGSWRFIDETPARRRVAAGRYEVKVELKPTGQTRTREVTLAGGSNPPVRVAFGRSQ